MTSRLREIMEREIKEGRDYGDLIMEVLVKSAAKGNIKAISMLMDRVDGKVAQQVFVQDGLDVTKLSTEELESLAKGSTKG